jgi:hypothetical protein
VTPANGSDEPEVGLAADGTATVLYGVQALGEPQALWSRVRGRGGRWSPSVRVAAEGYAHDLAVAPDGTAVVVSSPDLSTVQARVRSDGRWGKTRRLLAGGGLSDVDVSVDARGRFVVGVARDEGRIDVLTRPAGQQWSSPERLADESVPASEVLVATNADGDTFVGWGQYGVFGRVRASGGTWSRRLVAWPGSGVDVLESVTAGLAPDGDVSLLWDQESAPLRARLLLTRP